MSNFASLQLLWNFNVKYEFISKIKSSNNYEKCIYYILGIAKSICK